MQMILKASGFKEAEATQLITAYEKAKQDNPKLVFRDVMKFTKALIESREKSLEIIKPAQPGVDTIIDSSELDLPLLIDAPLLMLEDGQFLSDRTVNNSQVLQPFAELAVSKSTKPKNEVISNL
ncbi:hypothetical protein L3V82_13000 [Thiotrichales bacterium 19S3-7]|nr:hypothetical protein [Thiotrichales bacterium 19S3-7]MCF6803090.1 hypothetical protein [Thiotrichales bacterium 19S3-11]